MAKKKRAKLKAFAERQKLKRKHLEKMLSGVEREERRRRGMDEAGTPIMLDDAPLDTLRFLAVSPGFGV